MAESGRIKIASHDHVSIDEDACDAFERLAAERTNTMKRMSQPRCYNPGRRRRPSCLEVQQRFG